MRWWQTLSTWSLFFFLILVFKHATCMAPSPEEFAAQMAGAPEEQRMVEQQAEPALAEQVAPKGVVPELPQTQETQPSEQPQVAPPGEQMAEQQPFTPEGPDTTKPSMGLKGNWVKKKNWVLQAFRTLNEINTVATQIQGTRASFTEKYSAIDDELDKFYMSLGVEQGKLQDLFTGLDKYLLKKKRHKKEKLKTKNLKERIYSLKLELIEEKISGFKKNLRQLQLDMKSIEDLDKSVTQRLKTMNEKIKEAADIAKQAKELTTSLWDIIDHREAEKKYYQLKGDFLEKLNAIKNYLTNDLMQNYDSVIQSIKEQMDKSRQQIGELEQKGFIIKDRSKKIEDIKLKELREKELAEKAKQEETQQKQPRRKTKPTSWYDTIVGYVAGAAQVVTKPIDWLFGEPEIKVKRKKRTKAAASASDTPPTTPAPEAEQQQEEVATSIPGMVSTTADAVKTTGVK